MTLKEAHEIQRRELISLRAENARLKKQSSGLSPVVFHDNLMLSDLVIRENDGQIPPVVVEDGGLEASDSDGVPPDFLTEVASENLYDFSRAS